MLGVVVGGGHGMELRSATEGRIRKRKVREEAFETNERLHKVSRKLSLLNLELNGAALDVHSADQAALLRATKETKPPKVSGNDSMQVDNTAHKVYIYNLDDELSDSDAEPDEERVRFQSDFEKHLRNTRIPPAILTNKEGELAGRNLNTDLVLYNEAPASLSVPEDRDSVRKAIIESRARAREKQRIENERNRTAYHDIGSGVPVAQAPIGLTAAVNGVYNATASVGGGVMDEDPDAMDID